MTSNLKVPGVYVNEIKTIPASVAAVPTAIPAFIGYVERTLQPNGKDLLNVATRIESQKDFEQLFGFGRKPDYADVVMDASGKFVSATVIQKYYLYDAIRLFYANGGGECYICAIGRYSASDVAKGDFIDDGKGLKVIERVDEPTILLFPDAVSIPLADDLAAVQQEALSQSSTLMDRFTICDTQPLDAGRTDFRDKVGITGLSYGAAYTPWLLASLLHPISLTDMAALTIAVEPVPAIFNPTYFTDANVKRLLGPLSLIHEVKEYLGESAASLNDDFIPLIDEVEDAVIAGVIPAPDLSAQRDPLDDLIANTSDPIVQDDIDALVDELTTGYIPALNTFNGTDAEIDATLRQIYPLYRELATGLETYPTAVPPSGAVAGIYARTDAARGVWKAPANESINGILGPDERFTNSELGELNVTTTGKSINAIRAFTGKGTLIYGARTLAGNDGEYKYINVRRLLIFLEESIKKASESYVFEPNDANTWTAVRGMIENFLTLQWRAGALQGATAAEAFRVAIGLGQTMTPTDVLDGKMIVEISLAPVRPAEFIVLNFMQQQAVS